MKVTSPSQFPLALAALALVSCARNADTASTRQVPPAACTAADISGGHLAVARSGPVEITALRTGVSVTSSTAIDLTGPCAPQVVAADGGTFLLRGGTVVGLSAPIETGKARLQVEGGSGPFDRIKRTIASPTAGSRTGRLRAMTDAFDSSTSVDRYAAVWSRRSSSVIGFVDIDRSTGKRQELPLFELPLAAEVAYYQPAPDTNAGRMTVLAHVGGTARVLWVDVGI